MQVVWNMSLCHWASGYCLTLKMKETLSFKTFESALATTQHHIPEDLSIQQLHCENLKSHSV